MRRHPGAEQTQAPQAPIKELYNLQTYPPECGRFPPNWWQIAQHMSPPWGFPVITNVWADGNADSIAGQGTLNITQLIDPDLTCGQLATHLRAEHIWPIFVASNCWATQIRTTWDDVDLAAARCCHLVMMLSERRVSRVLARMLLFWNLTEPFVAVMQSPPVIAVHPATCRAHSVDGYPYMVFPRGSILPMVDVPRYSLFTTVAAREESKRAARLLAVSRETGTHIQARSNPSKGVPRLSSVTEDATTSGYTSLPRALTPPEECFLGPYVRPQADGSRDLADELYKYISTPLAREPAASSGGTTGDRGRSGSRGRAQGAWP